MDRPAGQPHYDNAYVGLSQANPVRMAFYSQDRSVVRHDHDFWEIALVATGRGEHGTDCGTVALRAGQVIVLRPGLFHSYVREEDVLLYHCWILPSWLDRELSLSAQDPRIARLLRPSGKRMRPGEPLIVEPDRPAFERCLAIIKPAAVALTVPVTGDPVPRATMGCAIALLAEVASALPRDAAAEVMPGVIKRTAEALEADIARAWRLDDLARHAGLSPAYLNRLFRALIGLPPLAYLARLRAERAASFLRRTSASAEEIGRLVGYERSEHFNRRFRERFGVPPGVYRKRHRSSGG